MLWLLAEALAQLAVASNDSHVEAIHAGNRFFERQALSAAEVDALIFGVDTALLHIGHGESECAHDLQLAWTTKLGSSVYSSPLLAPASAAGGLAAWASTFVRYAEAVDGADGHELPGWPYSFSHSTFHTSPLAYDVDADGVDELLLLSFDAELVFLSQAGLPLRGRGVKLPKLRCG